MAIEYESLSNGGLTFYTNAIFQKIKGQLDNISPSSSSTTFTAEEIYLALRTYFLNNSSAITDGVAAYLSDADNGITRVTNGFAAYANSYPEDFSVALGNVALDTTRFQQISIPLVSTAESILANNNSTFDIDLSTHISSAVVTGVLGVNLTETNLLKVGTFNVGKVNGLWRANVVLINDTNTDITIDETNAFINISIVI